MSYTNYDRNRMVRDSSNTTTWAVTQLVKDGIADRQQPTLINARTLPVSA